MSPTRRAFLTGGAVMAFTPVLRPLAAQEPRFFRIATGPSESGYFSVGSLIGNLTSAPQGTRTTPGLITVTQTTAGALSNIDAIRTGRFQSALCPADIADQALRGAGPFAKPGPFANLRAIARLYPEFMHVVLRRAAGIKELRQLRGKNVSLGDREAGGLITARALLPRLGLAERDIKAQFLAPGEAAEALRQGKLDAYFEMSGLPSPTIADLATGGLVDLAPISPTSVASLVKSYPAIDTVAIPRNIYRDLPETATISSSVLWLVDAKAEDSVVYALTRALWQPANRRALDAHPYGRFIRPEFAQRGFMIELHPGAVRFYAEADAK